MKELTKIHLLMERTDLQYVAEQLVDYYELSSKVKIKKGRYKDEKAFYHWHDNVIHIDPSQSSKQFIISALHEIFHAIQTVLEVLSYTYYYMKSRSAKNKGKRLQNNVRDLILEKFQQLEEDDVRSITMGDSGEDILLSPAARKLFPFSVECKNQEKLNVWSSLEQTETNAGKHTPLLIFKRNRSKTYAVLQLDDLMRLLDEKQ